MADFSTRYKLYPHRYIHTVPRKGNATLRDVYRERAPLTLKSCQGANLPIHDCREPIVKDRQDNHRWDCFILAHGLQATVDSVQQIHYKPKKSLEDRRPDKLLFHLGNTLNRFGSEDGEFFWPRGLTVKSSGFIVIADTMNHRIQILNTFGLFVKKFGQFGEKDGEFNEPTGVAIDQSDEILVADSKNRRVQKFTRKCLFKESLYTQDEPYSLALDMYNNTIVATMQRTIEIYRKNGKLVNRFCIAPATMNRYNLPSTKHTLHVAVDEMNQRIVVSDPADRNIKFFNYSGEQLSTFEPSGSADGLASNPAGIAVDISGYVFVCDALNHTVNMYNEKGNLMKQLVGPTDIAGCVQQCAFGPEGHLIVTEYSTLGNHSVKIFRYKDCECHRFRPGSSKRPKTPTTFELRTM